VIPQAEIVGPAHFGWDGMRTFNQLVTPGASDTWFTDEFLQAMKSASDAAGVRLLDAYDFHWYPQIYFDGNGVQQLAPWTCPTHDCQEITQINVPSNDAEFDAIVQNPRSYWDTGFDEHSWWTNQIHQGLNVINRIQNKIDEDYPGTKLGITEYFPGGGASIAGGIAEADSLGIFARMGVYVAALWPWNFYSANLTFTHAAMRMFRDFDGNSGSFGDTYVRTIFSDSTVGSAYASVDAGSDARVVVVLINKQKTAQTTAVRVTHPTTLTKAQAYVLEATTAAPSAAIDVPVTAVNAFVYTMPARSVTTLVLTP